MTVKSLANVIGGQDAWEMTVRDISYNPSEGIVSLSLNNYNQFKDLTNNEINVFEGQKGTIPHTMSGTFGFREGEDIKVGDLHHMIEITVSPKIK